MQKIVIIGGGLSGQLLAANLLRHHHEAFASITVIEKKVAGLLGHAYSTDNDCHLLNVPAHRMSAFPDRNRDFADWLTTNGYDHHGSSFVPRKIYKQYIFDILQKELNEKGKKARYNFLNDTVTDILPTERLLMLASGEKVSFDKVVLALGNFKATALNLGNNEYLRHPAYFSTAWNDRLYKDIPTAGKVLIIGSGLTMVDTVLSLLQQRHAGQITALSTHGLTPMPHSQVDPYQIAEAELKNMHTALEAFRVVRSHMKKAAAQGMNWRSVIDSVRPFTQHIWQSLPVREKRRFMEHLRHLWGVARHRVPGECWRTLQQLLQQEQLSIVAGRVRSITVNAENSFTVHYSARHSQKSCMLIAGAIVNCMGPESNYEKLDDPLVKNLLQKGLIRTDALKLGIDCTPEGVVVEKNGNRSPFLYTLGPPAKGVLWEITSVPEIRMAAARLAALVSSKQDEYAY